MKNINDINLPLVKGLVFGLLALAVAFTVFAAVLSTLDFPNKFIYPATLTGIIISIPVAGFVTVVNSENKNALKGGFCGFLYILALYIISSIIYRDFSIGINTVIMFVIGISSGIIGGLLGVNKINDKKSKKNIKGIKKKRNKKSLHK